jgi:hypothetical protein
MAMLGSAAMLLAFDIEPRAAPEHDEWHTREHLPERLGIPGFLRGSRWRAPDGAPRYFVVYEVAELGVLVSAAYRERLDNPTPWTRKLMRSYRGMRRGFCRLEASIGQGVGCGISVVRFAPAAGREEQLRTWLSGELMPAVAELPGFAATHLLRSAAAPAMTAEQELRGRDAGFEWVLLAMSHRVQSAPTVDTGRFAQNGAADAPVQASYALQYSLSRGE